MAKSSKSKSWKLTVAGRKLRFLEGQLILDDYSLGYGSNYNHPELHLVFGEDSETEVRRHTVVIRFQRHKLESASDTPAKYTMDTRRPWCAAYGGTVETRGEISLDWGGVRECFEDKLACAVVARLKSEIQDHNLHYVTDDVAMRAVKATEYAGGWAEFMYREGGSLVSIREISSEERYAARKIRDY